MAIQETTTTIKENKQIFIYYYAANTTVTVRYKDKASKQEIHQAIVEQGYEGKTYNVENKKQDIANYTYIETDGKTNGQMTKAPIEVIFYYEINKYKYTVEYYYDNKIDNSKTDTFVAEYNTRITTYKDKIIDGYKLLEVKNIPLIISSNETKNIIKVYYIKDDKGNTNENNTNDKQNDQTYGKKTNEKNNNISTETLPYTGKHTILTIYGVVFIIISIVSYIKYKKYKNI